jgi:periplasmic protein CpxP/Spy
MNLSPEEREQVATELKRFASDLNLTDDQKEKLRVALSEAREKIAEYLQQNPNTTKADVISKVVANRDAIRQRVVSFLSPRRAEVKYPLEEFIDRWAQHIPERYQHAVRTFGLFAPRALGQTSAAIFAILGQERKPRPKPRRWADSVKRDFGRDPLLDHTGKSMKWMRRIASNTTH